MKETDTTTNGTTKYNFQKGLSASVSPMAQKQTQLRRKRRNIWESFSCAAEETETINRKTRMVNESVL